MYAVTDLGTLGGDRAVGAAIDHVGRVVGLATIANGEWRAFLYEGAAGPLRDLGTLPGGDNSAAWAISDAGHFVGQATTATGTQHAVLWVGGELRDLGTLGGGEGYAAAVNNAGQVVGAARLSVATSRPKSEDELLFVEAEDTHAFLWDRGLVRDLGTTGGDYSEAWGINDAGVIVGSVITADHSIRAFVLDPRATGGMRILDPLPGGGYSAAHAIDAAGRIVGGSTIAGGPLLPVIYHDGPPRALPIPTGYPITKALAGNAHGARVGYGEVGRGISGGTRALLWRGDTLHDLNDLVQIEPDWVLTEARGINDTGQIVVNARRSELTRAFLLTPEAPSTSDTATE